MSCANAARLWRAAFGIITTMIRTRDFLLYILVFVFILIGIGFTVASETSVTTIGTDTSSGLTISGEVQELSAVIPEEVDDRDSRLTRLREKIAAGVGLKISEPPKSDETADEMLATDAEVLPTAATGSATSLFVREPRYCNGLVPTRVDGSDWPREAQLVSIEGAKVVRVREVYEEFVPLTSAATGTDEQMQTVTATRTRAILQLPTFMKSVDTNCLLYDVVGVTLTGEPIRNNDTWRFTGSGEVEVVGYALDGAPIFGPTENVAALDECGGATVGNEYRYYLRVGESFVLGCFSGTPAELQL